MEGTGPRPIECPCCLSTNITRSLYDEWDCFCSLCSIWFNPDGTRSVQYHPESTYIATVTPVVESQSPPDKELFTTGAKRDKREGKGRYDLISPIALRSLALTLERGAEHYGDRNWEKGMPICRVWDSAIRHLNQYLEGRTDEDHLGHTLFNVMALAHLDQMIKDGMLPAELDDRPKNLRRGH